ncbi:hypothetical protein VCHA53O466_40399 [Vibrio chagasii]|nr:hypothetical protein VCHA53O466_40399 [Vibrio chagasii]
MQKPNDLIHKLEKNRDELKQIRKGLLSKESIINRESLDSKVITSLNSTRDRLISLINTNANKKSTDEFNNLSSDEVIAIGKHNLNQLQKNKQNVTWQNTAIKAFAHEFEKGNPEGGYHIGLVYRDHLNTTERACRLFRELHLSNHLKSTLELIITLQSIAKADIENNMHLAIEAEQLKLQLNK